MDTHNLIAALHSYQVIQHGAFVTKSGRQTPYFFNTGKLCSGRGLNIFAAELAELICRTFLDRPRYLFGPAYKGIALAIAVAQQLELRWDGEVYFTFNRKEKKHHGEVSELVGYEYRGGEEVMVVEDVLTAGTSIRQSLELLNRYGVTVRGIVVGIDRQEPGMGSGLAKQELEDEFGIPVYSVLKLEEIF